MEPNIVDQLYDFTTSFPIDADACERVRVLADRYIRQTLKMDYYHVMIDGKLVNNQPGLGTAKTMGGSWCNDNADSVSIYAKEALSYRAQSTFSYLERKPLWLTSTDGKPLHQAEEYKDHWSDSDSNRLPKYRDLNKSDVMTSIIVPLRQGEGHVFGFLCLESKALEPINSTATVVLEKFADAIGAALSGYEDYLRKANSTRSALQRLQDFAQQTRFVSPLAKRIAFIASSERADKKVLAVIRKVIDTFKIELEPSYWKEDKTTGNVPARVQDEIARCTIGLCYFSELADEKKQKTNRYIDNPNVMFEAGMLQALAQSSSATPFAWIPIREKDSPVAPFDFAQERMVIVERLGTNSEDINEEGLTAELEARLRELLITRTSR